MKASAKILTAVFAVIFIALLFVPQILDNSGASLFITTAVIGLFAVVLTPIVRKLNETVGEE